MHTILEVLRLSTEYLQGKNIQNPRRQAEELIGEVLNVGRMGIYLEFDRPLNEEEVNKCRTWLKRRGQGEPLQYIKGEVDFLGCRIKVTPDVLIPRQETEILADKIIKEASASPKTIQTAWDICCGSGCIGIAMKKHLPLLDVSLSDLSPQALAVAKENAKQNQVDVTLFEGDLLAPFAGQKSDLIVCNPPYIAAKEITSLEKEVSGFEPKLALIGGETGLEFYIRLAHDLPGHLNAGGKVWLEIGDGQGAELKKIFSSPRWKSAQIELDWAGRERFFSLEVE